jgi:transposase
MSYQLYPTDLTDREWNCIKNLIPPAKLGGRPRKLDMRLLLHAICYVARGGIAWSMLPREYPHRKSIYHYLWLWSGQPLSNIHRRWKRPRLVPTGTSATTRDKKLLVR